MATNGDKVAENGGENTKKIVDLNTTELDRTNEIVDEGLSSESVDVSGEKKDGGVSKVIGSDSADDIQNKILVLKAAVNSSGGVKKAGERKKAEELKRKARANKFGVPASTTIVDKKEEEAKKKARLERFGKDTKAETKVDSAEEDKRKARALRSCFCGLAIILRFLKAASEITSDLTEKQSIGTEAAVSGKK